MLLKDIKLLEVTSLNVAFSHNATESGQGRVRTEYGDIEFEAGGTLTEDPSQSVIIVKATPSVTGFREGVEGYDFSLKISLRMIYSYPTEKKLTQEFLIDSSWYFTSLLKTYFKFYADDILRKTTIEGIKLDLN